MTEPRIVRRWDGAATLVFPFDRWLVDAIKSEIPAHARVYDPDTKSWTITAAYAPIAGRLMRFVFPDVVEEAVGAKAGPTFDRGTGAPNDPYLILHLRPSAPPELVTAAHRVLARLHHPDTGGDTATMQAINAAVDQIRSRT
jgi:hypothetical protein